MTQIILLTKGTGGDIYPLIAIGRALKAQGHTVALATHCVYEDLARANEIAFTPLDNFEQYYQMQQDDPLLLRPDLALLFHRRHVLSRLVDEVKLIKKQIHGRDTIIVSHISTLFTALIASESLQIPVVLTFLSPYQIKLLSFFAGLLGALADEFNHLRKSLALPPIHDWNRWLHSFQSAIGVWPDWFALPEPDWLATLSAVGFVLEQTVVLEENELPKEARETWAAGKPCLLITHGTSRPFEASFFGNSIAACLQLGYNGLVITPQPHTELITQQPSEIRWFEPRLLVSLLPHVDAIIHHGGIGTAAQALLAAKPQLIMGYGFDRLENAKLLQGIGAAEFLPHSEWQPTQIVTALRRLTNSSIVRTRCLELSRKMREENSLANAVAAIEATKTGANYIVSESFPGSYKKEQRPIFDGLSAERQELLVLRLKQKKLVKPRDRSLK